ncbi:MAG: preprotein translocase subunit SecE [Acidobacteriales bacterium]|jgi:preprotein translocase subunit SecE|nr:preprotein translocase subunit SecE [Terriglobales bacterium]
MDEQSIGEKLKRWPVRVKDYIGDLQTEMRRVTWPNWKQVRATTGVVILSVFLFAAYFAVVDTVCGRMIDRVFQLFGKTS